MTSRVARLREGAPLTALTTLAALAASAVLLLAGCAAMGDARPSHTPADAAALGATGTTAPWPAERWWVRYGDPALDRIVDQALAGAPTLKSAASRIRLAQAAVDVAGASGQPQLGLGVDLSDQRFTRNGLYPPPLAGATKWNANGQLSGTWELDLFGRQRAELEASLGARRAAEADAQSARVLLAANVSGAYFNLARLVETRGVAQASLKQREEVRALVHQRIGAGLDTNVELRQAEGLIAQSKVEIEALDEAIGRARHALAELAGQGPHAFDTLAPTLAAAQATPLPAALPADLVGRRADLVAQRWRVEAALHGVDVARAQFYPNVSLTAFAGLSSLGLDRFLEAAARTYGAGPALRLPIFDGGRLRANLGARATEVDLAVDAYDATLLRALREVADEVTTLQSLDRQQVSQAEATAAADAAYALAVQRYEAGLGNFLTVLTAQTNVLAQQRAATELKARHLASEVALARALGGGYDAGATAVAAAAPLTNDKDKR